MGLGDLQSPCLDPPSGPDSPQLCVKFLRRSDRPLSCVSKLSRRSCPAVWYGHYQYRELSDELATLPSASMAPRPVSCVVTKQDP